MKEIKKFESFFGGTQLGSDQVNTDSSVVKNNTFTPDSYSKENTDDKDLIIDDIYELIQDLDKISLMKIKSFIKGL